MRRIARTWMVVGLGVIGLLPLSCSDTKSTAKAESPSKVEAVPGSDLKKVTLTEAAVKRIDLKTEAVKEGTGGTKVLPYGAVLYDAKGQTYVYTTLEPRVYQRQAVKVDRIVGNDAFVSDGPAAGVAVVTVGATQLFGAESGIGK